MQLQFSMTTIVHLEYIVGSKIKPNITIIGFLPHQDEDPAQLNGQ